MKAVLAATPLADAKPVLEWCGRHLQPGDVVTVVYGVNGLGEFALGLPPLDTLGGDAALRAQLETTYCEPLTRAGLTVELRMQAESTSRAITDVAKAVGADMIIIAKPRHRATVDAILGSPAVHLAHDPPCPLVIVPVATERSRRAGSRPPAAADTVTA